ncbi:MAG: thioredoxin domain-containing protein [Candidatus Micrarchaeia archaeon]
MAGKQKKPAPSPPFPDYRWALALLAVVIAIAIIYYLILVQAQAPLAPPKENASVQVGAVVLDLSQEPVRGNPNASVWLVEFGDFQCPYCARAAPFVKRLLADFPDRLGFVWKHFPLDAACNPLMKSSLHPEACKAAEAAECAGEQGRFWEYHDRLLASQDALDVPSLKRYAAELGLDVAEFGECLDSGRTAPLVRADIEEAIALDVPGTPTFFINGHEYRGQWSDYEALKAAVAQAEARAG